MNMGGKLAGRRPGAGRAAIAALMMTTGLALATMAAPAHAQEAARTFDISAQPLANALTAFGQQSGLQVSAQGPLVEGRASSAVRGTMPPLQALSQLLAGKLRTETKPSPPSGSSALQDFGRENFHQQNMGLHPESSRQLVQPVDRDTVLFSLEGADIGPIDFSTVRQGFLRQPPGGAEHAQVLGKGFPARHPHC